MNQPWIYMCSPSRSFTLVWGVPLFSSPYVWLSGLLLSSWRGSSKLSRPSGIQWTKGCFLPGSLSMWFSREDYWSGLPFPSPGNLPGPGIKPEYPVSRIAGGFFTTKPPGKLSTLGSISQMVVVQLLSHVWLFATPWTSAGQASLSLTISWSLLKFMFIELVMPWALKINTVSVIFPCLWRSGNWHTHLQGPFFFFFWYFIDYLYCMCEGLAGIYSYLLGTRVVSGS